MAAPISVAVVVPVLDDAEALRRCLAAIAAQTRPADEVLVVDNGSSDDSVEVALTAGARVLHEPTPGITAAASRGYDAARSTVIARIDADTVVPADWLERALRWFGDADVTAVSGPGRFRDLGPAESRFWQLAYMRAYFALMSTALGRPPLYGSNMLFRRSAWLLVRHRVHRDDPMVHDDVDLALQFDPRWRTVYDGDLAVSVSSGPVRDVGGLVRRTAMAWRTFAVSGQRAVAPARLLRRVLGRTRPVPGEYGGHAPVATPDEAPEAAAQEPARVAEGVRP